MATNAGTTVVGMTMAIVYESAPGEYATVTTSGVGTSQEGETLALLLCIRRLAAQQGTYWWCLTRSRWAPSECTKKEGSVETGYTTCTRAP